MRIAVFIVLLLVWLVLFYFVGASGMVLFFGPEPADPEEPLESFRYGLIATSSVIGLMGAVAFLIRRRLFWGAGQFTFGGASGIALYVSLSLLIPAAGFFSSMALFMVRFTWGAFVMPLIGVCVGLVFLVLAFPVLPKSTSTRRSAPAPPPATRSDSQ